MASPNTSSSFYPSLDVKNLVDYLFPDTTSTKEKDPFDAAEELLISIPGAIVHLIDKDQSVELASGLLTIVCLKQGGNVVSALARIGEDIQWPLAKDEPAVKLDHSHYFFSLRVPASSEEEEGEEGHQNLLNYGLTIASKGQHKLLKDLDAILAQYSSFSVQQVSNTSELDGSVAKDMSPAEMNFKEKKDMMEENSAAYWTTLAPNVEDYSGCVARAIASGSGQLIRGIVWCGDVTVDRLKWSNQFLRKRVAPCVKHSQISPGTLKNVQRVKRLSKMTENVAIGILSGVVKVSGFFTSSIVNSSMGKKFFSLMPGEIVLASLDGFNKVCDAVEVAGRNVMSTTSVVTTGLVSHRYGDKAAEVTNEGFDATGHAIGTAWAVLKIRSAINPKNAIRPTTIVKTAARATAVEDAKTKTKASK
ncbi:hypothetical protein GIB67_040827 [Kingdonia uniflora]|uniref:Senescence domain-containing protein n=1 Tax=Kingdonia uniflora TaxID=39325 RepID=A0A7J7P5C8_9MAGN|nr:hypothetical protein GIB67_040827 [Kingdonia uniflora]